MPRMSDAAARIEERPKGSDPELRSTPDSPGSTTTGSHARVRGDRPDLALARDHRSFPIRCRGVAVSRALSRTLQLVGVAGRPCSWADKARLVGEDHRLDAAAEVEFAQDAADVGFDRALLEEKLGGDLSVALALGDQE